MLGQPSLAVAPGTADAAASAIRITIARLRLSGRLLKEVNAAIDSLLEGFDEDPEAGGQRDAEILRSISGVGRTVLATLLSEAHDPIRRRDVGALRALSGSAPVTKRSGKGIIVVRRMAVHNRVRNACHYLAGTTIQHDRKSRLRYDALRARLLAIAGAAHGQRPVAPDGVCDAARPDPVRPSAHYPWQGGGVGDAPGMAGSARSRRPKVWRRGPNAGTPTVDRPHPGAGFGVQTFPLPLPPAPPSPSPSKFDLTNRRESRKRSQSSSSIPEKLAAILR